MKTTVVDNLIPEKELFFIYRQLVCSSIWSVAGAGNDYDNQTHKNFAKGPSLIVKKTNGIIENYPMFLYGQVLVYRMAEILEKKKIGMHTNLQRMRFNITYSGEDSQHSLHTDIDDNNYQSILVFMTPIWKEGWKGSFYVDGEKFNFRPGSAIIFNSPEYHTGEESDMKNLYWQRLTLNMMVSK